MEFNAITYFEKIARESVYLNHTENNKHFGVASGIAEVESLCTGVLSRTDHQLVYVDNPSGLFLNNDDVNLIDRPLHSYIVLKHLANTMDMAERSSALSECKSIGRKIFTRMRLDAREAMKRPSKEDTIGLRHLEHDSMRYNAVPPLGDGFIGIEFSFSLANADTEIYDPDEWITNNS